MIFTAVKVLFNVLEGTLGLSSESAGGALRKSPLWWARVSLSSQPIHLPPGTLLEVVEKYSFPTLEAPTSCRISGSSPLLGKRTCRTSWLRLKSNLHTPVKNHGDYFKQRMWFRSLQYVWETGNSIATRMAQHNYIMKKKKKKKKVQTQLVAHFIRHGWKSVSTSIIESNPGWSAPLRKRAERLWITKLDTVHPRGLNGGVRGADDGAVHRWPCSSSRKVFNHESPCYVLHSMRWSVCSSAAAPQELTRW